MTQQRHSCLALAVLFSSLLVAGGAAQAQVTADQAKELGVTGTPLTPMGAVRAGNEDGSIPEWKPDNTAALKAVRSGNEKPEFSITSKNYTKYGDKLTEGMKALFKEYPDFRMDVYKTYRTSTYPDKVYKYTIKNATRAKLQNGAKTLVDAIGGTPFPIPQNGAEAVWNHLVAFQGTTFDIQWSAYQIDPSGDSVRMALLDQKVQYPYYLKTDKLSPNVDMTYLTSNTLAPAYKHGERAMRLEPLDYVNKSRIVMQYITGQRRLRKMPLVAFDNPEYYSPKVKNWDEYYMFTGSPERYDWKLLGKREMFIPYNNEDFDKQHLDEVIGKHFYNPDHVRWELHRVWVVDATLKPDARHAVPHRRLYLDEDSWNAIAMDEWDANGDLWKTGYILPKFYDKCPCVARGAEGIYDLQTGYWSAESLTNDDGFLKFPDAPYSYATTFTPEALSAQGIE